MANRDETIIEKNEDFDRSSQTGVNSRPKLASNSQQGSGINKTFGNKPEAESNSDSLLKRTESEMISRDVSYMSKTSSRATSVQEDVIDSNVSSANSNVYEMRIATKTSNDCFGINFATYTDTNWKACYEAIVRKDSHFIRFSNKAL